MITKNTAFPTFKNRLTPVKVNSLTELTLSQVQAVLPTVTKIQYISYSSYTRYYTYYIWLPDTVTISHTGFTSGRTLQWQIATRSNSFFYDTANEEILTMDIMTIYNT